MVAALCMAGLGAVYYILIMQVFINKSPKAIMKIKAWTKASDSQIAVVSAACLIALLVLV
jgi:hypothetical protein